MKELDAKFNPRGRVKFVKEGSWTAPVFVGETGDKEYPYKFRSRHRDHDVEEIFTKNGYFYAPDDDENVEKDSYDLINY